MPDEVTTAGDAGEEPREAVLATVDRAAVSPAVARAHGLDVLPGPGVDERAQGGRLARPQPSDVERVGQDLGHVLQGQAGRAADLPVRSPACREFVQAERVVVIDESGETLLDHRLPGTPAAAGDARNGMA